MSSSIYLVGKHDICQLLAHFFNNSNKLPFLDVATNLDTYINSNTPENTISIVVIPKDYTRQLPAASQPQGRIVSCLMLDTIEQTKQWISSQQKQAQQTPKDISILAQWNPHYLKLGNLWLQTLQTKTPLKIQNWMADKVGKSRLLGYIDKGVHTSIYFGHGRQQKMVGYHGISAAEICQNKNYTVINCFLSFSCYHLQHDTEKSSFGEVLLKNNKVSAFWGSRLATDKILNKKLALICLEQLVRTEDIRIDQWINRVAKIVEREHSPTLSLLWSSYSLLGNPFLPMR